MLQQYTLKYKENHQINNLNLDLWHYFFNFSYILLHFQKKYAKQRRDSAVKVGTIRLTSEFNSSSFGDGGVFFRHQRVEDQ